MMNENETPDTKKSGLISLVALVLFVGAVIYFSIEKGSIARMEAKVNAERLKSEVMLSEKLALEKEIDKQKTQLQQLEQNHSTLNKTYLAAQEQWRVREQENDKTKKQLAKTAWYKNKYEELLNLNEIQEQQLSEKQSSIRSLQNISEDIEQTVALLLQQNKNLSAELKSKPKVLFNNVLIEPAKKNNLLTLQASKTRKITIHMDVAPGSEGPVFKITDPTGKVLQTPSRDITTRVLEDPSANEFIASLAKPAATTAMKKIEMTYVPSARLKSGTYTISVEQDTLSIVSLQVRLR